MNYNAIASGSDNLPVIVYRKAFASLETIYGVAVLKCRNPACTFQNVTSLAADMDVRGTNVAVEIASSFNHDKSLPFSLRCYALRASHTGSAPSLTSHSSLSPIGLRRQREFIQSSPTRAEALRL